MTQPAADEYEVTDDLARIDLDLVHHWLSTDAYWALGRSREVLEAAARGSHNIGLLAPDGALAAYARLVTDRATFAWLCDVYVDRAHRGRGLGPRLAQAVADTVRTMGLTRVLLVTEDAHGLYERVGFTALPDPERYMVLRPRETAP